MHESSRCSPRTFKNVSCWPAKEASGRSSAVAEERTATANSSPRAHLAPGLEHLILQPRRERCGEHPPADLLADGGEPVHIVHIERREHRPDALIQAVLREEIPIGIRGGRKSAGHRYAQPESRDIISPSEAFLPPTTSTSLLFSFSNGMM